MNYYDFAYPFIKDEPIAESFKNIWFTIPSARQYGRSCCNELLRSFQINIQEENEKMNKCEFELGDILVAKDEVGEVIDGSAILICPGYNKDDFTVVQNDKGICVAAMKKYDEYNGDMLETNDVEEFCFDFNKYFKVEKVNYNVRDGIFILNVDYDTNGNVEIDESL